MKTCFLKKYKCKNYKDFIIEPQFIELLNTLINMDNLNILFIGNSGSGKTSIIESTIREYYNTPNIPSYNVLYINNLKEHFLSRYLHFIPIKKGKQKALKHNKKNV